MLQEKIRNCRTKIAWFCKTLSGPNLEGEQYNQFQVFALLLKKAKMPKSQNYSSYSLSSLHFRCSTSCDSDFRVARLLNLAPDLLLINSMIFYSLRWKDLLHFSLSKLYSHHSCLIFWVVCHRG